MLRLWTAETLSAVALRVFFQQFGQEGARGAEIRRGERCEC